MESPCAVLDDWLAPPPSPRRATHPGQDTRGVRTFIWPPTRTYTWPQTGTFSWPRTYGLGGDDNPAKYAARSWSQAPDPASDVWQPAGRRPEHTTGESPDLHQLVHQRLRTVS